MNAPLCRWILLGQVAVAGMLGLGTLASAEVAFDWAAIGHPENRPDRDYTFQNPPVIGFGAVDYPFCMSVFEVTNAQYAEFLNAVDAEGANANQLYHESMTSDPRGGILFDAAASSAAKYAPRTDMQNKPVNYVSFIDAMRFVNWLENGQPTDGGGTEEGVYTVGIGGDPPKPGDPGVVEKRTVGANHFIPNEHEWYKAAYFDPRSEAEGGPPPDDAPMGQENQYWLYPTRSESALSPATADSQGNINNPGGGIANFGLGADWNGQDGNVTTVGSAGPESASYYGTFDQGGNVWEWHEAVPGTTRGLRGGSWLNSSIGLAASTRTTGNPNSETDLIGFRVAGIVPGDLNHSCAADFDDIDPFVLGLSDPYLYQTTYRVPPAFSGDLDSDGDADFDDISPFVELLSPGGLQNVPEPAAAVTAAVGLLLLALQRRRRTSQGRAQQEVTELRA